MPVPLRLSISASLIVGLLALAVAACEEAPQTSDPLAGPAPSIFGSPEAQRAPFGELFPNAPTQEPQVVAEGWSGIAGLLIGQQPPPQVEESEPAPQEEEAVDEVDDIPIPDAVVSKYLFWRAELKTRETLAQAALALDGLEQGELDLLQDRVTELESEEASATFGLAEEDRAHVQRLERVTHALCYEGLLDDPRDGDRPIQELARSGTALERKAARLVLDERAKARRDSLDEQRDRFGDRNVELVLHNAAELKSVSCQTGGMLDETVVHEGHGHAD